MGEQVYNKLVRDKIPEMIKKANKEPITYIATEQEVKERLYAKLVEELEEFKSTPTPEELADILEVIDGIATVFNIDMDNVQSVKATKYAERGGFKERIVLDKVID
ncbi:nucleoside triphosphate pyrophosphohydrolase [Caldalkalibacillus mannanilyticus]|uniref:nucleoside triphosphate pyrophosphohydrolase n=1 Tax=Caldalkalibacillus mannanilyticus TaxID=1418 RepID=UPI00046AA233|nr:nucleoside triphosphate pyrophosphohydrolase [Caldalkalibacillus mannanilyticus]